MPRQFWIGQVIIPPAVASHIAEKHNLSADDIWDAIQEPHAYREAKWVDDPVRGPRLMVIGSSSGLTVKAYLAPVDPSDGTWKLKTAFRVQQ